MTTLHEEQLPLTRKHSLDFISDEEDDKMEDDDDRIDDYVRYEYRNKLFVFFFI